MASSSGEKRLLHLKDIRTFFVNFCKDADDGNPFVWESVTLAIRKFHSQLHFRAFQEELFKYILSLMDRYNCNDVEWLADVLHMICSLNAPHSSIRRATEHRSAMQGCKNSSFNNIIYRHWILDITVDDICQWHLVSMYLKLIGKPEIFEIAHGEDLSVRICEHYGPDARRRLMTVLKGFEVLILKRCRREHEKFARCLQQVFETIPEPHISSLEIRRFLRCVSSYPHPLDVEMFLQEISVDYEELFPHSFETKQPRSLAHLSRCQIRQNLYKAGTFPHGVEQLHLPKLLKQYILLQKDDF